jgi:HK97 gp10 family phage protein
MVENTRITGLRQLDKNLNSLELSIRKKIVRKALKAGLEPVSIRAKANAQKSEDTGGLAKTIRRSSSFTGASRRKAGRGAAAIGRVSMGRSKRKEGETGHQALQVEYGTFNQEATPVLEPSFVGHERQIIQDFTNVLKSEIPKEVKKLQRK